MSSPVAPPPATAPSAPPGWYCDHHNERWLWWDGWQWVTPPEPTPTSDDRTWFPRTPTLQLPAAALGIVLIVVLTIGTRVAALLPETPEALVQLGLFAVSTFGMPLAAWYGSRRWGTGRFVDDLGFRFRWIDVPLGIGGAIALTISLMVINIVAHVLGAPSGSNLTEVSERGRDVVTFATLFVTAGLIAPLTEELLFRGLLTPAIGVGMSAALAQVVVKLTGDANVTGRETVAKALTEAEEKRNAVQNQAQELGSNWVQGFPLDAEERLLTLLRTITAEEVQAVAAKYFGDDQLTVATLLPQPLDAPRARPQLPPGAAIR